MKITVIGSGNMGGALVHGWCKAGLVSQLTITARTQTTLERFRSLYPEINTATDNAQAVRGADVVIIAVKPWLVDEVIDQIKLSLRDSNALLVSVAAGVRNARINVYTMPNIAVQYGAGMTYVEEPERHTEQYQKVVDLFSLVGKTQIVPHKLMDAGMQISGCGIAYVMRYVRAMMEGGVELGLCPEDAKQAVLQTMKGAVTLLEESGKHPEDAIDSVTTPGGYTIRGLNAMEEAGFTNAVLAGLKANNKE
jgi:pyrroline-5-carboxylate reductase